MKYKILALFIALSSILFAQGVTPIADIIRDFPGNLSPQPETYTIEGVVTIGTEEHSAGRLRVFIQDNSGKGIALDDGSYNSPTYLNNFKQGHLVRVTGRISEYENAPQLNSLTGIQTLDFEEVIVTELTIAEALNHEPYYGLYIKVSGIVVSIDPPGTSAGRNIQIAALDNPARSITVRFWNTFGIDISRLRIGTPVDILGGLSHFRGTAQIIPGYQRDIIITLTMPQVSQIEVFPELPYIDQEITISAEIIDYDGFIASAVLFYKTTNTQFTEVVMPATLSSIRIVNIPAYNTMESGEGEIIFHIIATDNEENVTKTQDRRITVSRRKPVIYNITIVNSPDEYEELIVLASIIDSVEGGSITNAKLLYRNNFSTTIREVPMEDIGFDRYEAIVPGFSSGTTVNISIWAESDSNETSQVDNFPNGDPIRYVYPVTQNEVMLRIQPKAYNTHNGENVEIGYFVKEGDIVVIRIYNAEGKLAATPVNKITSVRDGINFYNWNGRDSEHRLVPPGLYVCHLEVRDRTSGKIKNTTAPIVIGTRLK